MAMISSQATIKSYRSINKLALLIIFSGIFFVAGCGSQPDAAAGQIPVSSEVYRPPTLAPTQPAAVTELPIATLVSTRIALTPRVTATVTCTNSLTYQSDLTIEDGSISNPGQILDKRWEVLNSGTCNWNENYSLRLINGAELGLAPTQLLFPALAGSEFMLRLVFTSPTEPGNYRSSWQAFDPAGNAFGDPVYIEINVK